MSTEALHRAIANELAAAAADDVLDLSGLDGIAEVAAGVLAPVADLGGRFTLYVLDRGDGPSPEPVADEPESRRSPEPEPAAVPVPPGAAAELADLAGVDRTFDDPQAQAMYVNAQRNRARAASLEEIVRLVVRTPSLVASAIEGMKRRRRASQLIDLEPRDLEQLVLDVDRVVRARGGQA